MQNKRKIGLAKSKCVVLPDNFHKIHKSHGSRKKHKNTIL